MVAQSPTTDQLGPYRLLEKIGEGGMGVVHRALDRDGRAVAVKVLRPGIAGDPDARRRLGREFETMGRVRSRFVAEVIDADVTGDTPYVVTRYVAGPSLDQLVSRDGPLRGRSLERVAWGLAEGLAAVHEAGVVHRDVKPGNVVMAAGAPVLIDFGIAHTPDATRITEAGMFIGTPGYLPPEVVEGQSFGPPADVHSWASTMAFAATGRPPFGTGSYETIFYRIVAGQPDLAGIPARLMPLVTAALSRDPGSRPTAVRLSAECAALDLSGPDTHPVVPAWAAGVPAPAGAPAAGGPGGAAAPWWAAGARAPAGAPAAGGPAGAAAPWWAAGASAPAGAPATDGPAQSRAVSPGTLVDGQPALAPLSPPAGRGTRPRPATRRSSAVARPGGFADVLPPVQYAAPAAPAARQAADGTAPAAAGAAGPTAKSDAPAPGVRGLLALLTMVIAVAASVMFPVAGAIAATGMIVSLRAADRAHGSLIRRRAERGARASDVPLTLVTAPWTLIRALFSSLLLAPLALACAAAAAAVTIAAGHTHSYQAAGAYAAGAFVAFYAFGLGSAKPRRQLGRIFGGVARGRLPAALAVVMVTVLAVAVAGAAATRPHDIWPLSPGLGWHGLRHLAAQLVSRLHHL